MLKLLLVEDDPFISEIYMRKFQDAGFDVKNAQTGREALNLMKIGGYDLVLLDLVIPEVNGMEVLREIRGNQAYTSDLRVVIFSNLSNEEERAECLALGADAFLPKTEFSPAQVVEEVKRYVNLFSEQNKNSQRQSTPAQGDEHIQLAGKGKRILLIEDEKVFVDMFSRRLQVEGYEVVVREDGLSGLQIASSETFDLIISDVMMPGMLGNEMVVRLRESEHGRHVPIFLLSASLDDVKFQELCDAKIAHRVFMKMSLTPSDLVREINTFFNTYKEGDDVC